MKCYLSSVLLSLKFRDVFTTIQKTMMEDLRDIKSFKTENRLLLFLKKLHQRYLIEFYIRLSSCILSILCKKNNMKIRITLKICSKIFQQFFSQTTKYLWFPATPTKTNLKIHSLTKILSRLHVFTTYFARTYYLLKSD